MTFIFEKKTENITIAVTPTDKINFLKYATEHKYKSLTDFVEKTLKERISE